MLWVLGTDNGVVVSQWSDFLQESRSEEVRYGGFLWPDIVSLEDKLVEYHPDLLRDFSVGWSAVVLPPKGATEPELAGFAPPTTARPHRAAPFGLYLLSADRLRLSFPIEAKQSREAALEAHRHQKTLGGYFCDPNLEISLPSGERDFHFRPSSRPERAASALKVFLTGRFES